MHHQKQPSHFVRSRSIVTLGVVMALSVIFLSAGLLFWRYSEVLGKARDDVTNVSTLISTQSHQTFQGIDVIQSQIIKRLTSDGADSAANLRILAGSQQTHENLRGIVQSIDILDAVSIIDDKGQLLNFSRSWPIPNIDVSDRDYFKALSTTNQDSYWSLPVRNRGNGALTIYHARRFNGANGELAGMVLAMLSVRKLEQQFASISLPAGSGIALYRTDGVLLARTPPDPEYRMIGAPIVVDVPGKSGLDGWHGPSPTGRPADGESLITAAKRVPDYPLLVAASSPRSAVFEGWRQELVAVGALGLALVLTIGVAGTLGLRQLRASDDAFRAEQHAARHDVLTGLPNRSYFKLRLDEMFCSKGGEKVAFALLLIDLDRFKEVNDSLGHAAGDELLKAVADRLRQAVGRDDFLARLGGDEFAVIHPEKAGFESVATLAEGILSSFSRVIRLTDAEVRITGSVGTAIAHRDAEEAAQLLANADLALFRAKELGRNDVHAYTDEIGAGRRERLALLRDLRQGVEESQFRIYFQPIVSLKTRRIVAFEALLRWSHPTRGLVPPAEFIPLMEESGLIRRIGLWVLKEACRQAMTWPDGVKVSVNLSPVQLRMQDIFAQTRSALATSGLPARRLMLEITESVQLDQTNAGQTLRNLREIGVGVSLDDFGTGYASLSYLRSFPFDLIKIDQSFVQEMHRSAECEVIVQTVLTMGERLGVKVTAEGVETFEQLRTLEQQGCSKVQGYLLGAPMPAGRVNEFISSWRFPSATLSLVG